MSVTYTYTLSESQDRCDPGDFYQFIILDGRLVSYVLSVRKLSLEVYVVCSEELSVPNKAILDSIFATYVPTQQYDTIRLIDQVSSDSVSSTTSTSYQTKLTMTTSPIVSGTYRIGWCYDWRYTDTSSNFQGIVVANGTTIYEHNQEPKDSGSDQSIPNSGFTYITLPNGVTTINIKYKAQRSDKTAYISNAKLELWSVTV